MPVMAPAKVASKRPSASNSRARLIGRAQHAAQQLEGLAVLLGEGLGARRRDHVERGDGGRAVEQGHADARAVPDARADDGVQAGVARGVLHEHRGAAGERGRGE
jgi:hypothetical protein